MKFYLGIHQPIWLTRVRDIPLLVSHRRLGHRRTLPRAITEWALDSGGFTELQLHGRWQTNEKDYVRAVRRYADEIGNLAWAAPQDGGLRAEHPQANWPYCSRASTAHRPQLRSPAGARA